MMLLAFVIAAAPSVAQDVERRSGIVTANGIRIAYQITGPQVGEAVLFIQGVGGAMPTEPDPLTAGLAEQGLRVIQFDNRDAGASTHLDAAGTPDFGAIQQSLAAGGTPPLAYTLEDMAADAVGLLAALDVERAHIVGGSLGGMIAQILAAEHTQRTASLTLISSSTGNASLPRGEPPTGDEPMDAATARQAAAASAAGDLRSQSAEIAAPTVVIHGGRDQLFPPAHGRDLAATIPGARLVVIPGMGHTPEQEHYPKILRAIRSVIQKASLRPELAG